MEGNCRKRSKVDSEKYQLAKYHPPIALARETKAVAKAEQGSGGQVGGEERVGGAASPCRGREEGERNTTLPQARPQPCPSGPGAVPVTLPPSSTGLDPEGFSGVGESWAGWEDLDPG